MSTPEFGRSVYPRPSRRRRHQQGLAVVEVFWEPHYRFGLKGEPLVPDAEGYLQVPTGPGLGVEIDWDWVDNHTTAELQTASQRRA